MKRPIALAVFVAIFLSLAAYTDAQDAKKNSAVIPVPHAGKGPTGRHEKFLAIAKKGGVDVLFLGDSITEGWEGTGKDVWKKTFEPLKAANFGIGGDRTEHVLWRITTGKELEGINPKVAVMMIGTNNTGSNSAEQIAEGVKAIVEELRKAKPQTKVLLLGVFPRGGKQKYADSTKATPAEQQPKIKAINDIIAKFDDGKHVFYLDIGGKFLDSDGNLQRAIMPDLLHLSPKGYEIWAEATEGKVKDLLK